MEVLNMGTIKDREFLMDPREERLTAFTPRPVEKFIKKKSLPTTLKIECHHVLRVKGNERTNGNPTVEWKLWKEVGKYDLPYPERPDPQYNANVWRNFRKQFGFKVNADGRRTSESLACMYPINIPKPSQVGEFSYARFIQGSNDLFDTEDKRKMAIDRTSGDVREFKMLKALTEARNPPIDKKGNIIPPEHYKRYASRYIPQYVATKVPTTEYLLQQRKNRNDIPETPKTDGAAANMFPPTRMTMKDNSPSYQNILGNKRPTAPTPRAHFTTPYSTAGLHDEVNIKVPHIQYMENTPEIVDHVAKYLT